MAEILTPWEALLVDADMNDWLELNPCECEGTCTCEQEDR